MAKKNGKSEDPKAFLAKYRGNGLDPDPFGVENEEELSESRKALQSLMRYAGGDDPLEAILLQEQARALVDCNAEIWYLKQIKECYETEPNKMTKLAILRELGVHIRSARSRRVDVAKAVRSRAKNIEATKEEVKKTSEAWVRNAEDPDE